MTMLVNSFWAAVVAAVVQPPPYVRSVNAETNGTGNITPPLPTGWKENDIFILAVKSINQSVSTPAGWTAFSSSPQGTGTAGAGGSVALYLFWRRATSSESAPTITDSGVQTYATIFAVAGCIETGSPIDVESGDVEESGSTTATWPAITPTVASAMVVNVLATGYTTSTSSGQASGAANSALLNVRELFDDSQTSVAGTSGGIAIISGVKESAGSTGSTTCTLGQNSLQGRITFALKPLVRTAPWFVSAGTVAGSTGSPVPGLPAGYAANDIFILVVESANESVSTPSGYTAFASNPQGTGTAASTTATAIHAFWKRASASESSPTVADSGDHTLAQIYCFRGCRTSGDPHEVEAGDVASTTTTSVAFPSVTTTGDERTVLHLITTETDSLASIPINEALTNSALRFAVLVDGGQTASGNGGTISAVVGEKATAGSTGSTTGTVSPTSLQGRITIALVP